MKGYWFILTAMIGLSFAGLIWLYTYVRRQKQELVAVQRQLEALESSLNALCAGAVGVDQRVSRLERQGRDLSHRQETMETRQTSERPFGKAIQMVHKGASAIQLIEELGLSRGEAELVVMLHGLKQTASKSV